MWRQVIKANKTGKKETDPAPGVNGTKRKKVRGTHTHTHAGTEKMCSPL